MNAITPAKAGSRKQTLIACAAIVIVSTLMLTYEIDEPFWGLQDFNCVIQSIAARNFLKYGLIATRFMPATNTGDVRNGKFDLYVHHPPLIAYPLAAFYCLFGETEWVGRLFFVLCAIGSALLVFLIGKMYLRQLDALLCALVFSLLPCIGYFGRMINYESPGLLFALFAFWSYCRFLKSRRKVALALL
ncbi:MAG TPA: glycosyltransferase family 39 protein [bacterium]|nr:glycosyltransferase family 39 protein [bacterium]